MTRIPEENLRKMKENTKTNYRNKTCHDKIFLGKPKENERNHKSKLQKKMSRNDKDSLGKP